MQAKLNLASREAAGKGVARKLRRSGRVPGVVYGGGGDPALVSMDATEALNLFQSIPVDNTILELSVDGEARERVLIREIQTHPFRTELLHVDFIRIRRGVEIELQIPIRLDGLPAGVRNDGGVLEQVVHDLAVKCLPRRIPEEIVADVTELGIGDTLRSGDLEMPEGVENLVDPERTICGVAAPRVAEVDEDALEGEEGDASPLPGGVPAGDAQESSGESD